MLTALTGSWGFFGPVATGPGYAAGRPSIVMQYRSRGPPIDEDRRSRSPGLKNNFYDMPREDFKRPYGSSPSGTYDPNEPGGLQGQGGQTDQARTFGAARPLYEQSSERNYYGMNDRYGNRGYGNRGYGGRGYGGRGYGRRNLNNRRGSMMGSGGGGGFGRWGGMRRGGMRGGVMNDVMATSRRDQAMTTRGGGGAPYEGRQYGDSQYGNNRRVYESRSYSRGGYERRGSYENRGYYGGDSLLDEVNWQPWFDAAFGLVGLFFLDAAFRELFASSLPDTAANVAAARVAALTVFAAVQQAGRPRPRRHDPLDPDHPPALELSNAPP